MCRNIKKTPSYAIESWTTSSTAFHSQYYLNYLFDKRKISSIKSYNYEFFYNNMIGVDCDLLWLIRGSNQVS